MMQSKNERMAEAMRHGDFVAVRKSDKVHYLSIPNDIQSEYGDRFAVIPTEEYIELRPTEGDEKPLNASAIQEVDDRNRLNLLSQNDVADEWALVTTTETVKAVPLDAGDTTE